ncbi:MAG TPA: hypothetical protein IAB35_00765 [Candidatus Faecimonas gallistercoris]|nr:hypothetical protein [Candidatus Faecimonas gallistercoris]
MTKSPKVIFNSIFTLAINNPDSKYKNNEKSKKRVRDMYDYYANEEKRAMSMYDYYTGKINKENTMNLVLENGKFASELEVEKRKKQAVKYLENSNLWQGVLSFNNDYINENIDIHKLEQELASNILPNFFKKCGFKDSKKMFYQLSLHTDTDNLHFHFSFMEKQPNYIYSKNKVGYRRSGQLTQSEIDFLKAQVVHTIEKEKIYTPLLIETNKEITELKKFFSPNEKNYLLRNKKDLILEEKILRLGQLLYRERKDKEEKIKYGSIKNKEIIELTKEIKSYLFSKKNSNFKLEYANFKDALNEINSYFHNIYEENQIKNIDIDTTLIDSKNKYIDNYIYNAIVNHANYNYKKELKSVKSIKENDIIQEIILKHYLKNKKQTRKDILYNYLSNTNTKTQFKNKNAIEQAIKNINDEMEEAQREFSRLFISNDKSDTL